MPEPDEKRPATFHRSGAPWAEDDYLELIACLRGGLSDDEAIAALGRSLNAIQARAQMMMAGGGDDGASALDALRATLEADPNYDWRTSVRAAAAEKGWHFWTRAEEEVLARGWVSATPMGELVPRLSLPEPVIVRHLIGMQLAFSTKEVADRLGTVPGGDLALRQELAEERNAATVWCLIITIDARRPQISIHGSKELAEVARDEALIAAGSGAAMQWWIAPRVPGSGNAGPLTGATVEPPAPARRATPRPAGRATPAQRRWARGPRP